MKIAILTTTGAASLLFAGQAYAQDVPETVPDEQTGNMTDHDTDHEANTAEQRVFTDEEVSAYVMAAMRIRSLRDDPDMDDTTRMAMAETIVAEAGLDPEIYTAIGQTAQTDPALAQRIQAEADRMSADSED